MYAIRTTALKALFPVLLTTSASSAQFAEDFSGSLPSPSWSATADAGYSIQFVNGFGSFVKTNGAPDGTAQLRTTFAIDGEFSISLDVDGRFDGALSEGLNLGWVNSTSFAQVFLISPQTYQALGTSSSAFNWNLRSTNTLQVKLRITRTGNTVSLAVDRGDGGFQTFLGATNPAFGGPVIAQLIATDVDSGSNAGGTSYFDNFLVQAGSISAVPEPGSAALFVAGALLISRHVRRAA